MDSKLKFERITLGVCYYPEHWDESLWRDDLRRMKKYNIEIVRIAEFAWNKFEPEEGVFTFDFFDKFMKLAADEGMKVIFCTPTATAPAWLSEKYPEILNADIDGHLYRHGTRRHNNLNSAVYREFAARITEKLAERYSSYPNLIGWQLDNEINCEMDRYYSESDHTAFRQYMKDKFQTLENLNKRMGTVFWNQTYTSWEQVFLTRRTNTYGETNPHMQLEEKRFISKTVIGFFKLQADIIKKYRRAGQFITTNGLFRYIDYHKLTDDILDFITYDNYPNFGYELAADPDKSNGFKDRNSSFALTEARSISKIFGIMEQQSGAGGWNCRMLQPMPKPGQMRLWTMQAIAHGADYIGYFRWRTCTFGTEIYWHGLNDYSNTPNRRLAELKQISEDIAKIADIAQAENIAEISIIRDYDNKWDADADKWHGEIDAKSVEAWFLCLQKRHIPFDFTYINDETAISEIEKYKALVYPHPTILTEKRAELLKSYVKGGGKIIFGCRTGYKDIDGRCYTAPMPCHAADIIGGEVIDYTFLSPYDAPEYIECGGRTATAPLFNDVLKPTDGEVAGVFKNNYYDKMPAIIKKQTGKGCAYYAGSAFAEDTAGLFADLLGMETPFGLSEKFELPAEVELAVRKKSGALYVFLLNYADRPLELKVNGETPEILSGGSLSGDIIIDKYGVMIFKC